MLRKLLIVIGVFIGLSSVAFAGFKTDKLVVDYGIKTSTIQVTDGAGDGKVLTSDAEGKGTWQTPTTGVTDHGQLTSTGTITHNQLESAITAIEVSTGTIAGDLSTETTNRIDGDAALGISTGTIAGDLSTETTNRIDGDNALGISTGTIAGDLSTETTNRINADALLGAATGQLDLDKVDKAGDIMTGDFGVPNLKATFGVTGSTITASGDIKTTGGAVQIGHDATLNSWKVVQVGADLVTYYYNGAGWVEAYRAIQ